MMKLKFLEMENKRIEFVNDLKKQHENEIKEIKNDFIKTKQKLLLLSDNKLLISNIMPAVTPVTVISTEETEEKSVTVVSTKEIAGEAKINSIDITPLNVNKKLILNTATVECNHCNNNNIMLNSNYNINIKNNGNNIKLPHQSPPRTRCIMELEQRLKELNLKLDERTDERDMYQQNTKILLEDNSSLKIYINSLEEHLNFIINNIKNAKKKNKKITPIKNMLVSSIVPFSPYQQQQQNDENVNIIQKIKKNNIIIKSFVEEQQKQRNNTSDTGTSTRDDKNFIVIKKTIGTQHNNLQTEYEYIKKLNNCNDYIFKLKQKIKKYENNLKGIKKDNLNIKLQFSKTLETYQKTVISEKNITNKLQDKNIVLELKLKDLSEKLIKMETFQKSRAQQGKDYKLLEQELSKKKFNISQLNETLDGYALKLHNLELKYMQNQNKLKNLSIKLYHEKKNKIKNNNDSKINFILATKSAKSRYACALEALRKEKNKFQLELSNQKSTNNTEMNNNIIKMIDVATSPVKNNNISAGINIDIANNTSNNSIEKDNNNIDLDSNVNTINNLINHVTELENITNQALNATLKMSPRVDVNNDNNNDNNDNNNDIYSPWKNYTSFKTPSNNNNINNSIIKTPKSSLSEKEIGNNYNDSIQIIKSMESLSEKINVGLDEISKILGNNNQNVNKNYTNYSPFMIGTVYFMVFHSLLLIVFLFLPTVDMNKNGANFYHNHTNGEYLTFFDYLFTNFYNDFISYITNSGYIILNYADTYFTTTGNNNIHINNDMMPGVGLYTFQP